MLPLSFRVYTHTNMQIMISYLNANLEDPVFSNLTLIIYSYSNQITSLSSFLINECFVYSLRLKASLWTGLHINKAESVIRRFSTSILVKSLIPLQVTEVTFPRH